MKLKRICIIITVLVMICSLTGCGYELSIHISKDNNVKTTINTMLTESEVEQVAVMSSTGDTEPDINYDEYETKEYRGQIYYYNTEVEEKTIAEYLAEEDSGSADISSDHIIIRNASSLTDNVLDGTETDAMGSGMIGDDVDIASFIEFMDVTVSFDDEIVKTNGVLADDKKSVWFDMLGSFKDAECIYAFTRTYIDNTKPSVEEYYKTTNYIKAKTKTFTICSPSKLEKAELNGTKLELKTKEEEGLYKASVKLSEGKNTLVLSNKAGDTTYELIVDKTSPVIKGIEEGTYTGKAKFTVSDAASGIKSVKINGKKASVKKCKKGYTLKEAGDYTIVVKDKAGNKTTAKVKITK
ncbi:MAG: hypothetical protein IK071_01005 [Lachnospiraceae bacterium]|nr:hypothetical protein [Lachnospiraceae bacterium]